MIRNATFRCGRWSACGRAFGLVVPLVVAVPADGDDVWVGRKGGSPLRYSEVDIRGEQAGELVFRVRSGSIVSKPLEQVARSYVEGEAQLNQAEQAFSQGNSAAAIPAYEATAEQAKQKWLRSYALARLVGCYSAEGRLVDAVKAWLEVLKTWPTYGTLIQPDRLQGKGSPQHRESLVLIDGVLAGGDLSSEVVRAIKKLQLAIWKVEQDPRANEAERRAATKPTGGSTSRRPGKAEKEDSEEGGAPSARDSGDTAADLAKANRLADAGKYDEALEVIQEALERIPEDQRKAYLPRLLAAKAAGLLARGDALTKDNKPEEAAREYVYGGLAAMHVVAFFPDSISFIESLYLAGLCHEKIGRNGQAIALYQECKEHATGRGRPEIARRATEALQRLKAGS